MKSLRTRSLVTIVAVVIPMLVAYAVVSHSRASYQLGQRFDGRMHSELRMLQTAVVRSHGDMARVREIVDLMPVDSFPRRRLFGIWSKGQLLLASQRLPFDVPPTLELGFTNVDGSDGQWRILTEMMPSSEGTSHRDLVVLVADPMPTRSALIWGAATDNVLPLLVALVLVIAGIYIALVASLRPLTQLAAQIRQRSADQLTPIATDHVPNEVLPIAESVNLLMARLGDSLERERSFTADAAHELRTPLTALKAHAQVALRAQDEELRRETLRNIARTVNRTDRLIAQLLTLARLDPDAGNTYSHRVDLGKVGTRTVEELRSMAEGRGQQLQLQTDPGVIVRGNADALAILTRNIVENAIQYSHEGKPIDVRVFADGGHGVLQVTDCGPGIPDEAKQEVFRRFRRIAGTTSPGTGLGLSIVQRIAELHGGEVALHHNETEAGLRVVASIPSFPTSQ